MKIHKKNIQKNRNKKCFYYSEGKIHLNKYLFNTNNKIKIIDIGPAHLGLLHLLNKA